MANILRSASQHGNRRRLAGRRREAFGTAYRYLRRHARWMNYAEEKRVRLPIRSGVTEAACRTVFAARLKRSGMTWGIEGGQVIVDLRVLVLSQVWERAYAGYLKAQSLPEPGSYHPQRGETPRITAEISGLG